MNSLKNINSVNFDISVEECLKELRPHPKFASCTFDNYFENENYPSQALLKNRLKDIKAIEKNEDSKKKGNSFPNYLRKYINNYIEASEQHDSSSLYDRIPQLIRNRISDFAKRSEKISKNIYIDGTYGIGKTHLLSATFHSFNGTKAFMSFLELTYFMNYLGLEATISYFKDIDLLLIDEFDLDDPATTRMVARFIDSINFGTTIITTSNRLPEELGGGKFDVTQFARELGAIAASFDTITVDGESFRIKISPWQAKYASGTFEETLNSFEVERGKVLTTQSELKKVLEANHPFKFFAIARDFDAIFIEDFEIISNLNDAIRFTTLIDHCYYHNTKIFIKADIERNIFAQEIMETSFERQFGRCNSRLDELGIFFSK